MGNSYARPKTEESSFGFAFNNPELSDRTLRLEILPPGHDDHDLESNSNIKVLNFHTHSLLLAARSPFFRKLLNNGMKESQGNATINLRINASEEEAVMDLLGFIYEKPLKANSEAELLDVLIVADKYEVTCCVRHCIHMLGKLLTVDSALFYLELPSMIFVSDKVQPLLDQVKKYLASHFKDFTESQQAAAMELPLTAIEAVLGGEGLEVDSEDDVFDFALRWARQHYPKLEERREILSNRLAPLICFENVSWSKLKSNATCPEVSELVINALSSKVDAPAPTPGPEGAYIKSEITCTRRVYNNRLGKVVVHRCVVYLNLMTEDAADLDPAKQLCSQTFCVSGQNFYLSARRQRERDTNTYRLGVYLHKDGGSETCTLDVRLLVFNRFSQQYTVLDTFVSVLERGYGRGFPDPFKMPWNHVIGEHSPNLIFGTLVHLRADINFLVTK